MYKVIMLGYIQNWWFLTDEDEREIEFDSVEEASDCVEIIRNVVSKAEQLKLEKHMLSRLKGRSNMAKRTIENCTLIKKNRYELG